MKPPGKRDTLSEEVKHQIQEDAKNHLKQTAETRGIFSGRAITWAVGKDWTEKLGNWWRSLTDDRYVQEVRDEFFEQLQAGLKNNNNDIGNLTANILAMSESDIPKDKMNELIVEAYENNVIKGLESEKEYNQAVLELKKKAVEDIDEMAMASVTSEESKEAIQGELDRLKIRHGDNVTAYAKEVIKILIDRSGDNVDNLIIIANNMDLLFEKVAVKRNLGEAKKEIDAAILTKMNDILGPNLTTTIGRTGMQWSGTAVFNALNIDINNFLQNGGKAKSFPFFLAERAV